METVPQTAVIADDDEFFRVALKTVLINRLGFFQVHEAGSLDEALDHLGEPSRIDLALFDLSMPGMKSPANLKTVREYYPDTRIVIVSSSESRRDILAGLGAGVHGYIPKGLGVAELTGALRKILAGTIYVPPHLSDISLAGVAPSSPTGRAPFAATDIASSLTPRQREVLELIVAGKSNKEIARALQLREGTVKIHVAALLRNLGVSNRTSAAAAGSRILNAT